MNEPERLPILLVAAHEIRNIMKKYNLTLAEIAQIMAMLEVKK
jgi:hypothetical protein